MTHLFIAGVPATGKSSLGRWLAKELAYFHIDAERDEGSDFDRAGIHVEWNEVTRTGRAALFAKALDATGMSIVIDWGFPPSWLYVVRALQEAGITAWWIHGDRAHARKAYVQRYLSGHGWHPKFFDPQMDEVERHWLLLASVFGKHMLTGLNPDGSQRRPEEMWAEMTSEVPLSL